MQFYLPDEAATSACGASLATFCQPGLALLLKGDLGAGKSGLARAIIQSLCPSIADVPSPTFTLMQSYDIVSDPGTFPCWHVDLYRIEEPAELIELDLESLWDESLMLIEWPERLGNNRPLHYLEIDFSVAPGKPGRMVEIRANQGHERLLNQVFDVLHRFRYDPSAI